MINMPNSPTTSSNAIPMQPQYVMTDADRQRQKAIDFAWKAYRGDIDPPLAKMPGEPDDNVMSNRCMQVVDQGVNFLFGKEVEISVEDAAPADAQTCLNTIWGRKEARIPLLQKLAMSGAIAGTAFLRIVPEPKGTYRLIAVDPSTVFVQTAPQDVDTVILFCIEYCTSQMMNGVTPTTIYYREEICRVDPDDDGDDGDPFADADATWQIQHWTRIGDKGNWIPCGDPIMWDYDFPPLFYCQNLPYPHDFWGLSDLPKDFIGLNIALNLVQSNINRVEKMYGQPILYATGVGDSVIDIKPGRIIGLPTPDSKILSVPITSDTTNAMVFAENLRSDMDEQSAVPGIATGRMSAQPKGDMSGVAIELMFMPLLKKTEKKQCLYGELLINVSKALLVLNNMSEDIDITLAWQNPLPHDDVPATQAAVAKLGIGISATTLQRELGYDPEQEKLLNQADAEQKVAIAAIQAPPQKGGPNNGGQTQNINSSGSEAEGEQEPSTTASSQTDAQ